MAAPLANQKTVPGVASVRFVIPRPSRYVMLGRIGVDVRDASIYVAPFGPDGQRPSGWVGRHVLAPQTPTFDITNGAYGRLPKVSLHESGQAHARARGTKPYVGTSSPLWDAEGGHVATLLTFNLDDLPPLDGSPSGPPHLDALLKIDPSWTSARVSVYVYSDLRRAAEHSSHMTLIRPGLPGPLYVALGLHGDRYGPDNREPGVIVYAGWGHGGLSESRPTPLIYAATSASDTS